MKVLLINHYAGSLYHGMEYRPFYFAREWKKNGHSIDIIAASFSHLRINNPSIDKEFLHENIEGINYHWIKTRKYFGNGISRAITMFQFVAKLYIYAKKIATEINPDVVIASSTYPLDTFAAQRIAKIAKAKLIHEVHDMWPLTLMERSGMSKYNPFIVMMQIAENSAYKQSDTVVSLLPNAKSYMIEHGLTGEKFCHIPNGIVTEDWNTPESLPEEHQKIIDSFKKSGKFIICYFGGHATSNALAPFIEAAKYLSPKAQLLLVGHGVEKENLIKQANEQGTENIVFLPPVSKKAIPVLLEQVDSIYIGAASISLYRFGISMNKMYDSMMAGKPIVCSLDAFNNDVIDYNCGLVAEPGNAKSIADAINKLIRMTLEEQLMLGNNGKRAALEFYTYNKLSSKFESLFTKSHTCENL